MPSPDSRPITPVYETQINGQWVTMQDFEVPTKINVSTWDAQKPVVEPLVRIETIIVAK